jgi:hypothetical protein
MSAGHDNRRRRPSPALVVAALALFVALASTALAVVPPPAAKVSGAKLKKGSEPGNRFVPDSITGKEVKESKLGTVPEATSAVNATSATHAASATTATNAGNASTVGGASAASLTVTCPAATRLLAGGCVELGTARAPANYIVASQTCGALGRTLPSATQLLAFLFFGTGTGAGPEISADLFGAGNPPTFITVDTVTGALGTTAAATAFRCVAPLSN